MTCIGVRCAIIELFVAEEAAPTPSAITLLHETEERNKTPDVVAISENVLITKFFFDFNYPWSFAVAVFAARIWMTLEMFREKKTC